MSRVRCREGHGGKFTRPRSQWKGKARATHTTGRTIVPSMAMPGLAAFAGRMMGPGFGQLQFRRKTGDG
jgi:hypothetical protein